MCGIAGFVGEGEGKTLSSMISVLKHRGPDDTGIFIENGVGLAHARLAIVDLSAGGHQPMHSGDGNVVITFNGEIYNYKELRDSLQQKGRVFRSQSDTEVIIQLYEEFGEAAFEKLLGMYAFALYDKKHESLYLVRDRMGEKPLYWTLQNGAFVFASEPKALFVHPSITNMLNKEGVVSYLTYDACLTPTSLFVGIQKLEPAHYILFKQGEIKKHVYWHPPQKESRGVPFQDALETLDAAFEKSVRSQMVADVPVGIFLSGGLDSSLVAYYAKRVSKGAVHTFSLGFENSSYDESPYAKKVAEALDTVHHEKKVTAREVRDALPEVIAMLDEPIADPAILPNYLLSKFARKHVTVALGGDGGDELFAGYQTFVAEKYVGWYRALPAFFRKDILEPLVARLPVSHKYFSFDFKARQFLRGAYVPAPYMHQAWLQSFSNDEQKELLTPAFQKVLPAHPYERIDDYVREMPQADKHLQASYVYLRTYMQDDILAKVDRASMICSLEVRAPFLAKEIVETALSLPWNFKFKGTTGKFILRKLMENKLPHDIVWRGKHGFGLPVGEWFRREWRPLLEETLSAEHVASVGICEPHIVTKLVEEHVRGTHNHRKKLWSLLVLHLWYARWINTEAQ